MVTPYRLSEVLGAMLVAVTEAQYISDLYTDSLYQTYRDDPQLDGLAIPNTEFERVRLCMSFAIADVVTGSPIQGDKKKAATEIKAIPAIDVYVNASDLKEIPEKDISKLDIELLLRNIEALPAESEPTLEPNS